MSKNYPYSRSEEMAWSPKEASQNMSALAADNGTGGNDHSSRGWMTAHALYMKHQYPSTNLSNVDLDYCNAGFKPVLAALWDQFQEPLILLLLVSAGVSLAIGNGEDAISIAVALTIVCIVGAIQEYKSCKTLQKLVNMVPPTCQVVRNGSTISHFSASELVLGDLILLQAGDRVPADCRLIDSQQVSVDESTLTGETTGVYKTAQGNPQPSQTPTITQQRNVVFCGTCLLEGRARGLVLALGKDTEFGRLANQVSDIESRKSPLQQSVDHLGKLLAALGIVIVAAIALLGIFLGRNLYRGGVVGRGGNPRRLAHLYDRDVGLGCLEAFKKKRHCEKIACG